MDKMMVGRTWKRRTQAALRGMPDSTVRGPITFRATCSGVAGPERRTRPFYEIAVEAPRGGRGAPGRVRWPERLLPDELRPGDHLEVRGVVGRDGACHARRILNLSQGTVLCAPSPRALHVSLFAAAIAAVVTGVFLFVGSLIGA